ncbi:beta-N-acetylhexosaminidase [Sinobaca qinghaiensis]|uniref:beta-N-acetylhexosaminidase n=1 Tax=Sinobaca qinghaiensis TaxID=342944 RepID=A0A419UWC7_9BACL|nr:glycoside hydrolase family 3 protein [Sinobaca qinghaiensis]RKD69430.1 beta-N-acetylhexosaminidase [Sinobaca qinghaiensis]
MKYPIQLGLVILLIGHVWLPGYLQAGTSNPPEGDLFLLENVPYLEKESLQNIKEDHVLTVLRYTSGGAYEEVTENIKWRSSNPSVAKIDKQGSLSLKKSGRTKLTVSSGTNKDSIILDVDEDQASLTPVEGNGYAMIDRALKEMTLEEKIGQMMMPDYRTSNGENVTKMNEDIKKEIQDHHVGGTILFSENVESTEQTVDLVQDYKETPDKFGMLVTIDQEGGIVTRLQEGTDLPGNMAIGAADSDELAQQAGSVLGAELASLGINMNLAPVMDVNNNPDNPVIGVRSFGENPVRVGELGNAYAAGLQENNIAAIAKHFPGHGDTSMDSHIGLPEVPHDRERLFDVELVPFLAAQDKEMDAIMTAHVTFPNIDDTVVSSREDGSDIALPATLSKKVLSGLMREEMGFEGVVMTDAMNMEAINTHFEPVDAAIRTINAGTDIVLMPVGLPDVYDGVLEAVETGAIKQERIDEAVKRILLLKMNRGIFAQESPPDRSELKKDALAVVGSEEHQKIEQNIAEQSITVVKNNDNILPLKADSEQVVTVIDSSTSSIEEEVVADTQTGSPLADEINSRAATSHHIELEPDQHSLSKEDTAKVEESDVLIISSMTSTSDERTDDNPNMMLFNQLIDMYDIPVIGVGIRNPYDLSGYEKADAYVAQYGFQDASFAATGRVLFGEVAPQGHLPVSIPAADGTVLYPQGHGLTFNIEKSE